MTTQKNPQEIRASVYEKIGRIASTLGSAERLKFIQLLAQGPKTVEQLSVLSDQSFANTSQHLQKLAHDGIVVVQKRGLHRVYRIENPKVIALWENLQDLAHGLAPTLDALEDELTDKTLHSTVPIEKVLEQIAKKRAVLIDVRETEEAAATPVAGSLQIPLKLVKENSATLPKSKMVYVFCRGRYCSLATEAVKVLRRAGFEAYRLRESSFRLNEAIETKKGIAS